MFIGCAFKFSLQTNLTINLSFLPLVSGNRWAIEMSCLDGVYGCFGIVDWAIKMVDFVVLGFAPVVKIVYLFLDWLHWLLKNGIIFIADQLLWRLNRVEMLWQISYQAGYLFNFTLQFISDFFLDVWKEFCLPDLLNVVDSERFWGRTLILLRSSEVASGRHDTQAQQAQRGTSIHWTCTLLKWCLLKWCLPVGYIFVVKISVSFCGVCNS